MPEFELEEKCFNNSSQAAQIFQASILHHFCCYWIISISTLLSIKTAPINIWNFRNHCLIGNSIICVAQMAGLTQVYLEIIIHRTTQKLYLFFFEFQFSSLHEQPKGHLNVRDVQSFESAIAITMILLCFPKDSK